MFDTFWGKASPDDVRGIGIAFHPLAFHALDVAAVAECLLDDFPGLVEMFAHTTGASREVVRCFIIRLVALHDIGKYCRGFQAKVPALWPAVLGDFPSSPPNGDHTLVGYVLLADILKRDLASLASFDTAAWRPLVQAVVAHHGRPLAATTGPSRSEIGPAVIEAARGWIARVVELFPGPALDGDLDERDAARLSLSLAGFVNLADWVGSDQTIFAYAPPGDPASYLETVARPAARRAIARAGLGRSAISSVTGFRALTGLDLPPSPLQHWAETVELPDGPSLILIEETTGGGKTEAALILAHRLMALGAADGLYVALPTQATANAMYRRLGPLHRRMFAPDARPSLALAHGGARLDAAFRASIVDVGREETPYGGGRGDGDETASAACAAWIADDRRRAFFADVGAGTIDQAFLAVLPSKFAALRLLGLSRRVLIIDEAHCYGAYESEELSGLIRFHAAQGGVTIILSATLSERIKDRLVAAFRHGAGAPQGAIERRLVWPAAYPAATLIGTDGEPRVAALETRSDRRSRVTVERIVDAATAVEAIRKAAAEGAAVAWIRNTVDDVLDGAAGLARVGLDPIVFHARFAMIDRQAVERRVTETFGRDSRPEVRAGRVVVASQVIEQSLDLDFDLVVTDLAPIDLVVQRAGRLWRHTGRPRPIAGPRLLVVSPDPADEIGRDWYRAAFPRAAHVYRNHALVWKSARVLFTAREIAAPETIRPMIEAVYGREALDDAPVALERSMAEATGRESADASLASQNLLDLDAGYAARSEWGSDVLVPTRLGEERRIFRLARWDGTRLTPWAPIEPPGEPLDHARAWALSEVALSAHRASGRGTCPPEVETAAAAIEARWRERGDGRSVVLPVFEHLPEEVSGKLATSSGADFDFSYGCSTGLLHLIA